MSPRAFDRLMLDVEIGRNLKLSRLSPAEFKAHVAGVLPIAAKAPVRGCFLIGHAPAEAQDVAWQAGVTTSVAQSTLRKLRELGVLYRDDEMECERVHDWEQLNPEPKRDATAAERARRYRERHKDRDANGAQITASHRDDRDANRDVTPPEVEGEVEEPPNPQGGKVVTFDRRPVPKHRVDTSERLLHAFNARAGTDYGAYTGDGKPSESLRRIIGALTRHPNVSVEQWEAAIRWRFEHSFWDGVPDTGVVFGPKVDSANLASSMQEPRRQADLTAKLVGS